MTKKKKESVYDLVEREFDFDRPMEHLLFQSELDVPAHIIPKDKVYYWARAMISVTGFAVPDANRVGQLMSRHYRPVPADRHPELAVFNEFDEREGKYAGYIMRKGSLLMEIDKPYYEAVQRALAKYTMKEMQQTGLEQFAGDRMMPSKVFNEFETGAEAVRERGRDLTFNY